MAVFASLCLGAACLAAASVWGLLTIPAGSGGLAIALGLSAGGLCVLGCYDDVFDLRPRQKLWGQIAAALPVLIAGCWVDQVSIFGYEIYLGWLGVPCTVVWLIVGINALNLIDGMDGLASVVGVTVSGAIAAIAMAGGQPHVALLAFALAGALIGFLAFNLPPAQIFLGDCGSMLIGLFLSVLSLQLLKGPAAGSLTVALALFYVPFLDTMLAVVRRLLKGRGIMAADREHVHHRLLDLGFGPWGVLGLLGGFCVVSGTVAWGVMEWWSEITAWTVLGGMTIVCVSRRMFGYEEWGLLIGLWGRMARGASRTFTASHNGRESSAPRNAMGSHPVTPHSRILPEIAEGVSAVAGRPARQGASGALSGEPYVELLS
jgi:UDP-GlcNAc:undecaprenyl-phosphate GlcNAc-1-phosphate transferase